MIMMTSKPFRGFNFTFLEVFYHLRRRGRYGDLIHPRLVHTREAGFGPSARITNRSIATAKQLIVEQIKHCLYCRPPSLSDHHYPSWQCVINTLPYAPSPLNIHVPPNIPASNSPSSPHPKRDMACLQGSDPCGGSNVCADSTTIKELFIFEIDIFRVRIRISIAIGNSGLQGWTAFSLIFFV